MELVRATGIARKGLQDALSPAGNPKQLGWFPISSPRTKIKLGRNTVAGKVTQNRVIVFHSRAKGVRVI